MSVNLHNNFKVSIIIPVYNTEQYLHKCLDSVVNQTLKNIEIICVNDGSEDSSLDILKEYAAKDNRIVIIDQTNQGISVARNHAISVAKGEFLGFVDSDDWVDLDYFEKLYEGAVANNCEVACAGFRHCRKNRTPIKLRFKKAEVFREISDKVKAVNIPDHNYVSNKIFRREAWFKTGIVFPEGRFFEDMAILLKMLYYTGDLVTVPDTYYWYNDNPKSIVNTKSQKNRENYFRARKELFDFADEHYIKLDKTRQLKKYEYIKLFGITIFKNIHYENRVKCLLFGIIPVFTRVYVYR